MKSPRPLFPCCIVVAFLRAERINTKKALFKVFFCCCNITQINFIVFCLKSIRIVVVFTETVLLLIIQKEVWLEALLTEFSNRYELFYNSFLAQLREWETVPIYYLTPSKFFLSYQIF